MLPRSSAPIGKVEESFYFLYIFYPTEVCVSAGILTKFYQWKFKLGRHFMTDYACKWIQPTNTVDNSDYLGQGYRIKVGKSCYIFNQGKGG